MNLVHVYMEMKIVGMSMNLKMNLKHLKNSSVMNVKKNSLLQMIFSNTEKRTIHNQFLFVTNLRMENALSELKSVGLFMRVMLKNTNMRTEIKIFWKK